MGPIWVADAKMTSDPADAIHHHIFSLSLHDHLAKEKPGWPPKLLSTLFDHVDWAANGDALRGYPPPPIPAPLVNAWKEHNMSPSAHTLIMTWCGKRPSMGWLHGLIYPTPIQRYGTAFAQHSASAPLTPALLLSPHQPSRLLPCTRMPLAG